MNMADEEEILSAVSMTVKFYGKPFDELTRQFWRRWTRQQTNKEMILEALRQYPNVGKFCPKPADIYSIMQEITPPRTTFKEQELVDDCPEDVRRAWIYWMNEFWQMPIIATADLKALKQDKEKISEEQAEEWLILVNHEAKKYNLPDSIPDTHKLTEIWT